MPGVLHSGCPTVRSQQEQSANTCSNVDDTGNIWPSERRHHKRPQVCAAVYMKCPEQVIHKDGALISSCQGSGWKFRRKVLELDGNGGLALTVPNAKELYPLKWFK